MKNIFKNIGIVIAMAVVTMSINITNVFALENGIYTVSTITHYLNPETGKTDDGGTANAELGEGMCRSAVYEKALVQKDNDKTTLTMRMLLYSNLSEINFYTQQQAKGEYAQVKYSILKESSSTDSADIQFDIPSVESNIKVVMYVAPMKRNVCFYMNCDEASAVEGNSLDTNAVTEAKPQTQIDSTFSDINNHWAEKSIMNVVNKNLFSGTSATTFSPDGEMTRGMFVTVLGRMSGEDITGNNNFSDVDSSKYYAKYIGWANSKGIVSGTSATTFSPDTPVTCEQAAVILVKYANYKNISLETKSISPSLTGVSNWAVDSVKQAGIGGIINKQNTNGFSYQSSATRACVASMISNFMEYYGK